MSRKTFLLVGVCAVVVGSVAAAYVLTASGGQASEPSERETGQQKILSRIDALPRSDFQAALLADGELTEAEYDQAFAAFSECVTQAGGEILGPGTKTKYGIYDFSVGFPPIAPGVPNAQAREAAANCESEYWSVVSQHWQLTHMAPRSAYDEAMATVPGCMKARGVTPPDDLSRGWGERYLESGPTHEDGMVLVNCAKEAAAAAGLDTQVLYLP